MKGFWRSTDAPPNTAYVSSLERQNEQLRRAVDELSLLNDLAGRIGALADLDEVMQTILRQSLSIINADQGVITIIQDGQEKETLRTLVRTAVGSSTMPALRPGEGLLGWMHHHRAPLRVNDAPDDPRFRGVDWPEGVASALCAPLSVRSRLTGIITLYNKRNGAAFTDEDQRLLAIIASQSAQVIENARLYEEEKTLLRVREELRLAYEIQTSLLPEASPALPGYDIMGVSIPAQEVGGDYYDFIPGPPNRLICSVADVVGKGLPASLLMATTQATLRAHVIPDLSMARALERANDQLCHSIKRGKFVTVFHGCIDSAEHVFSYANAGHNRPILRRSDGRITYLSEAGIVLGVQPGWAYHEASVDLHEGDVLLIYSDGLTEAMNAERDQFGEARVEDILHATHRGGATDIVNALRESALQHAAGEVQSDDITIIVVKRMVKP